MYFILFYKTVEGYVEKRKPYRNEHLDLAKAAFERGDLVMAGALDDPADEAVLVFRADDRAVAEEFAKNDPYVVNGLICEWTVRRWNVVFGRE